MTLFQAGVEMESYGNSTGESWNVDLVLLLGREKGEEMEGRWGEKTKREREESFVLDYLNTDIDFCICQ